MNNVSYGYENFKNLNVIGTHVLVKKLTLDDLQIRNGVYVPETAENKNLKMGIGQILMITDEESKSTGLKKDDYILYDYYSANGDWKDNIITKSENIILKLSKEEADRFLNGCL